MQADSRFTDYGVIAAVDEHRAPGLFCDPEGEYCLLLPSKGYILNIHLNSKTMRQTVYPDGIMRYPFQSFISSRGYFYTGSSSLFMEFDPRTDAFTFWAHPHPSELVSAFCITEAPDGIIWFASYPSCLLYSFDPISRCIREWGRMDDTEKYVGTMAVGRDGWVYMGIGTERRNMVAFHPETGQRRSLIPDSERTQGSGCFHVGSNGELYGRDHVWLYYEQLDAANPGKWKSFHNGMGTECAQSDVSPSPFHAGRFMRNPSAVPDIIRSFSLAERELIYVHPESGEEIKLKLDYAAKGADVRPMVAGGDGNVYGTTCHPLRLFRFDPHSKELCNYSGKMLAGLGGGGNICAYAVQNTTIVGAHYPAGNLLRFDTTRPLPQSDNPSLEASCDEIYRPRVAIAHPDGQRVIFGGFAGYGAAGGGLCIYDCQTRIHDIIPNSALVPYQSTIALAFASNGDLLGGCTVETPGGATPKASHAELYRWNMEQKELVWRTIPLEGNREIIHMVIAKNDCLHCLTGDSKYFVFDVDNKKVIYQQDCSCHGVPVRAGMIVDRDQTIYGLLSQGIYRILAEKHAFEIMAKPPVTITAGIALLDGKLYFGATSSLWSYSIARASGTDKVSFPSRKY